MNDAALDPRATDRAHTAPPEVNHPWRPTNIRGQVLATAESLVNGERNASYGDPNQDFARTAEMWSAYLFGAMERRAREMGWTIDGGTAVAQLRKAGMLIDATDVALMMALLKISRLAWSPDKADSWIDLAGYAGCGADCAGVTL